MPFTLNGKEGVMCSNWKYGILRYFCIENLISQLQDKIHYIVQGLGIKSWQLFFCFLLRLIDHEEPWKYTNGSGWC